MAKTPLNVRISTELKAAIRKQAQQEWRTVALVVELALRRYLESATGETQYPEDQDIEAAVATSMQQYLKEQKAEKPPARRRIPDNV